MIETDKVKCLRCAGCVGVCPVAALSLTEHGIECDAEKCTNCRICVEFCPVGAISLKEDGLGNSGKDVKQESNRRG